MMISIIVPVYKVESFICQCVDSILAQTYRDLEIILVDDGSPDNCPAICDAYAHKDSRVKVVHKENGGLMSARQAGINAATGDYVGFVDGDDWIEPDMYASLADAAYKYNADMVFCEFNFAYADRVNLSEQKFSKPFYSKKELENEIYPVMLFDGAFYSFGVSPSCWSKLFKKNLLQENLLKVDQSITIGEDAAFTYPCIIGAESAAYVNKHLYNYRINPKSMTNAYSSNMENIILIPYYALKKAFGSSDYDFSAQLNYYLIYLVNGIIRNEAKAGNGRSLKDTKSVLHKFLKNKDVCAAAKSLDYSLLPFHTKVVAKCLAKGWGSLLCLYILLLKKYLN